jgi:uncharacterized protein YjbI with pentapeptide repeats
VAARRFSEIEADERCEAPGCQGAVIASDLSVCFRHTNVRQQQEWLERLGEAPPAERHLDLRGVDLTRATWEPLAVALAEMGAIQRLRLSNASVADQFELRDVEVLTQFSADGAEFGGPVRIANCKFARAQFFGAEFNGPVELDELEFARGPAFIECVFRREVDAGGPETPIVFRDGASFARTEFEGEVEFNLTGDGGRVSFAETKWSSAVAFHRPRQRGELSFRDADFGNDLILSDVSLGGTLDLSGAQFAALCLLGGEVENLSLRQATFVRTPELGPLWVKAWAVLDQAVFEHQVRLRILAAILHCHRTIFTRGVTMAVAGDLLADGSFFPPPSDIAGTSDESIEGEPRVVSLRGADIAGLNVSEIDLSGCLFSGIHHLEGSRLGGGLRFGTPPGPWRGPRDVLAEEQLLRFAESDQSKWQGPDRLLPKWFVANEAPSTVPPRLDPGLPAPRDASSVADTYRALRQAREENKDSPGAAAFYFGEMEMRRKSLAGGKLRDIPERTVLASYWLLSGYGLRAWRSLLTLGFLLALSTLILWRYGFRADGVSIAHAGRVAVASATSLVRPVDDSELNGTGFAVEIVLRFAGPALLALAVLAIRARIKR